MADDFRWFQKEEVASCSTVVYFMRAYARKMCVNKMETVSERLRVNIGLSRFDRLLSVYVHNLPYIASILFTRVKFIWTHVKIMRQLILSDL